jgi:hypothetical protein
MHPLAKFGLTTVLVTLALLSNVVVMLSALSGAVGMLFCLWTPPIGGLFKVISQRFKRL